MANSRSGDSVIDRLVRVLAAFDPEHRALSTDELARRADLPLSTTYRLVGDMTRHGLLDRSPEGAIQVGVRMWELANRASESVGLIEIARPALVRAHASIGEHVQLGILREGDVLYIERLSSPEAVVNIASVAGRLPAHASAAGLVLLAHAPAHTRHAYLRRPLPAVTPDTITDPVALEAMLAEVRHRRSATLPGHMVVGTTSLAVPIEDGSGAVVAALAAVVGTEHNVGLPVIMHALRTAAKSISAELAAG